LDNQGQPLERIDDLRVFLRTAELESFTHAALSLGLPKATVSAAVARLERSVGARLLQRTTRRVRLTPDGQMFRERCRDVLADFDELASLFRREGVAIVGRLRVDMPVGLARRVVIPGLPQFLARYPQLDVELGSTDRRVDVIREGFDCVVRVGAPVDGDLVARPLGALAVISCASAAYLKKHGSPKRVEDLDGHLLVRYAPAFGGRFDQFEYFDGETYRQKELPAAIAVNNSDAYTAACLAGLGIIQSPRLGLEEHLRSGELKEILPRFPPAPMPVHLLYPHRRHVPLRVRYFMEWLESVLRPVCQS
jgi:DNA-binding transcriptional LysR family regulator